MINTRHFMPKRHFPIGLALAPHDIMAAQFERSGGGVVVRQMVRHHLPLGFGKTTEARESVETVLRRLRSSSGFKGKTAVVQLPAQYCYSLPIQFELAPGQEMESEIVSQCRKFLTFPVEEAVIDYPSIVSSDAGGCRKYSVNIIAAQRDVIVEHLDLLEDAGFRVAAVDYGIGALLRLHMFLHPVSTRPMLLCHVGRQHSLLGVVCGDRIIALRHFDWGLEMLIHHLNLNLGFKKNSGYAEMMLAQYGLSYEQMCRAPKPTNAEADPIADNTMACCRTAFQVLDTQMNLLTHELHQLMGYVRSELQQATVDFEQLYLYGPTNGIRHLDHYLQARLNIPTRAVEPMEKLTFNPSMDATSRAESGAYAMAMGLAMREVPWL